MHGERCIVRSIRKVAVVVSSVSLPFGVHLEIMRTMQMH